MGLTMGLKPGEKVIDDDFFDSDFLYDWKDDRGEVKGRGHDPSKVDELVRKSFGDPPSQMDLIPETDWKARLEELVREEALLSHIRNRADRGRPMIALDQNGQGYCWFYSVTGTVMLDRAVRNMPFVRLSAHAGAAIIKNFRDEGGWCGLAAEFYRTKGCPSVEFWPEKSMSRQYDKPETWENAALHKITEDWVDLTRNVWDQKLTFQQVATCLLSGIPCALDFNWWGHSVCGLDLVLVEPGSWGIRILNSWTNQWGENGTAVLRGAKAIPNGAIATRSTRPSLASLRPSPGIQMPLAV